MWHVFCYSCVPDESFIHETTGVQNIRPDIHNAFINLEEFWIKSLNICLIVLPGNDSPPKAIPIDAEFDNKLFVFEKNTINNRALSINPALQFNEMQWFWFISIISCIVKRRTLDQFHGRIIILAVFNELYPVHVNHAMPSPPSTIGPVRWFSKQHLYQYPPEKTNRTTTTHWSKISVIV